jgi:hypothetical protein
MAAFPTETPPELQSHEDYARFWLGNLSETQMSSADMQVLIAMNIGKYGEDNCKIAYYSMLDILRWLIREGAKGSAGSAGSGAVKLREESIGRRKIREEFDTSGTSATSSGFDKVLEDLLANPSTIGCNPIDSGSGGDGNSGSVIIGVNTDKYTFSSPYRRNLNKPTSSLWKY